MDDESNKSNDSQMVHYPDPKHRSRRDFLEGAGATAVVGAAIPVLGVSTASAQEANSSVVAAKQYSTDRKRSRSGIASQ